MTDLPVDLLVSATIRTAAREGVPVTVLRHGHNASGTIMLKINRLDGTARVLTQVRYEGELVWSPVGRSDPMAEAEADKYLASQAAIDPDSWLIEIEDRQGRTWFQGKVMQFT